MANGRDKRRLTAILAADVVGYSRLMGVDESGTRAALRTHRSEVVDSKISGHEGRIVSTAGDSVLAEFGSVVDAVRCAAEIQRAMAARNEGVPEDKRIRFRIGVNLGDIIVEGDDIHGDGVNVAARLESLADPGGIFISGDAFRQVENKLELGYEDLGEQKVKNIAKPIEVYRVLLEPEAAGTLIAAKSQRQTPWRWLSAAAAVLAIIIAGGAIWNFAIRDDRVPVEAANVADTALPLPDKPANVADTALPLPEKPSIAVLPFDNLSNDPEQEYFAVGMSEDIITDLSKISGLFVIARNSSFAYKGKQTDVRTVARQLGVKYVLEGSVRRAGDTVRITAQLIDAATGGHLWAERYDGTLADVFALQDRVTERIVEALEVTMTGAERELTARKETDSPEAYDAFLKGWQHYQRRTPDDFGKAITFLDKAVKLDPNYSRAYAALAATYWNAFQRGWSSSIPGIETCFPRAVSPCMRDRAENHLEIAMEVPTPLAHQVSADMLMLEWRHDEAVAQAQSALALDKSDPDSQARMALVLTYAGRASEALPFARRAMRLDPNYPAFYDFVLSVVYYGTGNAKDALAQIEKASKRNPLDRASLFFLAAAYAETGERERARQVLEQLSESFNPNTRPVISVRFSMRVFPFRDAVVAQRFGSSLITAGACCEGDVEEMIDRMRAQGKMK